MTNCLVRVHDLTPSNCVGQRLSVAPELGLAAETIDDGFSGFLPDAIAPSGPWRVPSPQELSALADDHAAHEAAPVFVVALPEMARSLSNHLQNSTDLPFLQKAVKDVAFLRAIQNCIDELIPFCLRPEGLVCQGAWVSPGGMQLVTHNMKVVPHLRIGLHVDDWDHLPLAERAGGRRRLCVNLGSESRYLLFLTTPLSSLVAAGQFPKQIPEDLSPAIVVRSYLASHRNQIAVRLRIDPGEAYIMNADDIIHDGASAAPNVPDIALHFLGFFGPGERSV